MNNKMNKVLAIALAVVTLASAITIGTLAYLKSTPAPIVNTFVVGQNITIELTETKGTVADDDSREFKALPGTVIEKDPTVIVKAGSEACYLFVKVEETFADAADATWRIAEGWTEIAVDEAVEGTKIYYRTQGAIDKAAGTDASYKVLADNKVTMGQNAITGENPTMTFTAYAIQSEGLAIEEDVTEDDAKAVSAWKLMQAELTPTT